MKAKFCLSTGLPDFTSFLGKKSLVYTWLVVGICCLNVPLSAQIQTVNVTGGRVEGALTNGIASFKGIPFAAPPVGNLRWKAPQPIIPWEGVRKADAFGPTPMQDQRMSKMLAQNPLMSEDCLYLNVWTGAKEASEKRPVMVWIYGGGFSAGATSTPLYDGTAYAQKGIVFVTIAYRVGPMGFLAHPDLSKESGIGSGCYGIQDQLAALRWVKANIARFGGDPQTVTIAGQSAGSFSTSILSAAPKAKGLFHRIISQSGAYMEPLKYGNEAGLYSLSLKLAEKVGQDYLSKLGADNIEAGRLLSAETIQNAMSSLPIFTFWPVADGETIPGDLYNQYVAGKFNDVPLIIGTNSDEGASFVQPAQTLQPSGFQKTISDNYGPAAEGLLKVYPHSTDAETFQSQKDIWRETLFSWSAWTWANLHAKKSKKPTYVYYFDIHNDKSATGAAHSAEISYVLRFPYGINRGQPTEMDKSIMDLMSSYWINFVKTGNPNGEGVPDWLTYDQKNKRTMIFNDKVGVRPLPNVEKYKAFDAYYDWRRKQNTAKN